MDERKLAIIYAIHNLRDEHTDWYLDNFIEKEYVDKIKKGYKPKENYELDNPEWFKNNIKESHERYIERTQQEEKRKEESKKRIEYAQRTGDYSKVFNS